MRVRSLSHLSSRVLLDRVADLVAREREITAELILCLAEVLRRRLYVAEGYSSLYTYCVRHLGLSEDSAWKRIRVARVARRFPRVLDMIADGRLHLSAVVLLAPHLERQNVSDLLTAATRRSKREIEKLLAERFPKPDVQEEVRPLAEAANGPALPAAAFGARAEEAPAGESHVASSDAAPPAEARLAPGPVLTIGTGCDEPAAPAFESRPRIAPLAPQRYAVQFTMDEAMHADLLRAQELLGHRVVPGDVTETFRRALRELVTKLEKQKFAATSRPRAVPAPRSSAGVETGVQPRPAARSETGSRPGARSADARHIPAAVRREIWHRDQGRCTFVGTTGHRCEAQDALEFDHVVPVARGGPSTPENLRLLCRAHNQHEAEQAFGEGFMHGIRERRGSVAAGVRSRQ